MSYHLKILFPLLLWVTLAKTLAQDEGNDPVSKQLWLNFNPSYKVAERVTLYGAVGARTIFPNTWSRYLITPSVKYDWPRMILKNYKYKEELHAGVGVFFTDNNDAVNRLEIRPFQGYSLTMPNRHRIQIKHFVKLEERFEMETDDWVNTFGLRLRYTASLTFRFHGEVWAMGNGFFIPVSGEFFWNLKGTKQFNDKIRLMPGIGRDLSPDWKVLFLLGWFYSKASADKCYPLHPHIPVEAKENRKLLIGLFENEDFAVDLKEYWHFDYGNVSWAIEKEEESSMYDIIAS